MSCGCGKVSQPMACTKCMDFWTALIIVSVAMLILASMKPSEA